MLFYIAARRRGTPCKPSSRERQHLKTPTFTKAWPARLAAACISSIRVTATSLALPRESLRQAIRPDFLFLSGSFSSVTNLASQRSNIWRSLMGRHYPAMTLVFVVDLLGHPPRSSWRRQPLFPLAVDECGYRSAPLRKSLTRTALPCERGTAPELLMSIVQVTPIIDLRC